MNELRRLYFTYGVLNVRVKGHDKVLYQVFGILSLTVKMLFNLL